MNHGSPLFPTSLSNKIIIYLITIIRYLVIQVLTQLTGECNMWRLVRSLYEDRQCRIDSPDVPDPDNLLASDQTIISQLFDSSREIREVLAKKFVKLYIYIYIYIYIYFFFFYYVLHGIKLHCQAHCACWFILNLTKN